MLFNTYTFIVFFSAVLFLHYMPLPWRVKKANLLWASYLFYAAWNPPFVVLLWISTLTDWLVAKRIYLADKKSTKRLWLYVSLSINLGFLVYFKYSSFLLEVFTDALSLMGVSYQAPAMDIILPVGISFYTFQTLSYTLDIYKGKMKPWNSLLDFGMYVTFFPQLVAGPIVRAADFLPQCQQWDKPTARQFNWGLCLVLLGLFQKTVLADGVMAPYVETVYDSTLSPTFMTAWAGSFAFFVQLFFDFAGYSTVAIGVAMCLGFKLSDNFRFPFAAQGYSDFWKRWHISLSSWLGDYVFKSLPKARTIKKIQVNTFATMLVSGLWHGASWNFVLWGALHGLMQVVEISVKRSVPKLDLWGRTEFQFLMALFSFSTVAWTACLFRAQGLERSVDIGGAMLGFSGQELALAYRDYAIIGSVVGVLFVIHFLLRNTTLEHAAGKTHWIIKSFLLALMAVSIVVMPGEDRAFVYFQF